MGEYRLEEKGSRREDAVICGRNRPDPDEAGESCGEAEEKRCRRGTGNRKLSQELFGCLCFVCYLFSIFFSVFVTLNNADSLDVKKIYNDLKNNKMF